MPPSIAIATPVLVSCPRLRFGRPPCLGIGDHSLPRRVVLNSTAACEDHPIGDVVRACARGEPRRGPR